MPEPLSPRRRALFALGNPGYQITDRIVVMVAVYFYLPPPGRGLEPLVPEAPFWGPLTVFGAAMMVGRIFFDTTADPVVGYLSDRSRARMGRRRVMLALGLLPMVLAPVLVFFPPFAPGSVANGVWLAGLLAVYFVAFTAYVAPYFALIPEVAWTQEARLRLSQWMQFASLPALAAFSAWGVGLDWGRAAGLSPTQAVRALVLVLSALALLLALAPIVAVDEGRHARGQRSDLSFGRSLAATLRNPPFLIYLAGQCFFILGINLVQPVFPYLATVVLGRSEGFTLWLTVAMAVGIGLGFALQRPAVARLGPKRTLMACVALAGVSVAATGLLEADVPGGPRDRANLLLLFPALALFGAAAAGLLALPHVLVSQLIDADEARTGASRAAMFFGVQGLLTKWVYGLSTLVFTFLLARYGNSPEEPTGVLLVGPVAGVFCLLALVFYARYPERSVLGERRGE